MQLNEVKNAILFEYHKDINYWWKLLGEMYEKTDGFTKDAEIKRNLDGYSCLIEYSKSRDLEISHWEISKI